MINNIDDLLYKVFLLKYNDEEKLILIFKHKAISEHTIDLDGSSKNKITNVLSIVDINSSILVNRPVYEEFFYEDLSEFEKNISSANIIEHAYSLNTFYSVTLNYIDGLEKEVETSQDILSSLKFCSNKNKDIDANFSIINDEMKNIVNVPLKSIHGDLSHVTQEDIQRINDVIKEVIHNHLSIDENNPKEIKKLKAELEYKLIEALPSNFSIKDIDIDVPFILSQIKIINNGENLE